jgi:hypothetical protein
VWDSQSEMEGEGEGDEMVRKRIAKIQKRLPPAKLVNDYVNKLIDEGRKLFSSNITYCNIVSYQLSLSSESHITKIYSQ